MTIKTSPFKYLINGSGHNKHEIWVRVTVQGYLCLFMHTNIKDKLLQKVITASRTCLVPLGGSSSWLGCVMWKGVTLTFQKKKKFKIFQKKIFFFNSKKLVSYQRKGGRGMTMTQDIRDLFAKHSPCVFKSPGAPWWALAYKKSHLVPPGGSFSCVFEAPMVLYIFAHTNDRKIAFHLKQ